MIILGLVLLVVVAAVVVIAVSAGGDRVLLHLHWFTLHTNGATLFIAGAATLAVAVVALWMLRAGLRRSRRRRREIRELRQQANASQRPSGEPATPRTRPGSARGAQDTDDHYDTAPRD